MDEWLSILTISFAIRFCCCTTNCLCLFVISYTFLRANRCRLKRHNWQFRSCFSSQSFVTTSFLTSCRWSSCRWCGAAIWTDSSEPDQCWRTLILTKAKWLQKIFGFNPHVGDSRNRSVSGRITLIPSGLLLGSKISQHFTLPFQLCPSVGHDCLNPMFKCHKVVETILLCSVDAVPDGGRGEGRYRNCNLNNRREWKVDEFWPLNPEQAIRNSEEAIRNSEEAVRNPEKRSRHGATESKDSEEPDSEPERKYLLHKL